MTESEEKYRNIGTLFTIAGTMSFISAIFSKCNTKMIIISNLLFFSGVYLILGTKKFFSFITNQKRIMGIISFGFGFVFVLFGRNFLGTFLEIFSIFVLFGGFLPKVIHYMRSIPIIGKYFRFALPSWLYRNNEKILP